MSCSLSCQRSTLQWFPNIPPTTVSEGWPISEKGCNSIHPSTLPLCHEVHHLGSPNSSPLSCPVSTAIEPIGKSLRWRCLNHMCKCSSWKHISLCISQASLVAASLAHCIILDCGVSMCQRWKYHPKTQCQAAQAVWSLPGDITQSTAHSLEEVVTRADFCISFWLKTCHAGVPLSPTWEQSTQCQNLSGLCAQSDIWWSVQLGSAWDSRRVFSHAQCKNKPSLTSQDMYVCIYIYYSMLYYVIKCYNYYSSAIVQPAFSNYSPNVFVVPLIEEVSSLQKSWEGDVPVSVKCKYVQIKQVLFWWGVDLWHFTFIP